MNSARIFLDFSSTFKCKGVMQQSCILLDYGKHVTVRDVEDHIRRVFDVDRPFHILNEGWLLPSSESALLMRDNETVSIVPKEESHNSESTKKSKKSDDTEFHQSISKVSHTTNDDVQQNTEMSENNGKPSITPTNEDCQMESIEKLSVCVKNPFANEKSARPFDQTASSGEIGLANGQQLNEASLDHDLIGGSESGERKRKRIRRRKKKTADEKEEEAKTKEVKPSPYIMNKYLQGVSHILKTSLAEQNNRKHIFFKDGEEENSTAASTEAKVESAPKRECPTPPSSFLAKKSHGDLSKLLSLGNQKSPAVFERKKVECSVTPEVQTMDPPSKLNSRLVPLSTMPVKETIIKFQILKMVNYSPTISEIVTARVISPDFTSNQIYVQIKDGLSELGSEKGKFSLDVDEEEEEEQPPSEYAFLNWHELIEPKAVEYF